MTASINSEPILLAVRGLAKAATALAALIESQETPTTAIAAAAKTAATKAPTSPSGALTTREKKRLSNEAYRRTRYGQLPSGERVRASQKERNQRAIERIIRADGLTVNISTTADTSAETVARFRRRQASLLSFASKAGVKITTKVVAAGKTTRLEAKVVKA